VKKLISSAHLPQFARYFIGRLAMAETQRKFYQFPLLKPIAQTYQRFKLMALLNKGVNSEA
jgi:hypothetical protein